MNFTRGEDSVSFIAFEKSSSPETRYSTIEATLPAAQAMVQEVIDGWTTSTLPLKKRFRHDPKVCPF